MSTNKVEPPKQTKELPKGAKDSAPQNSEKKDARELNSINNSSDVHTVMNEIYEKVEPDSVLRNIVTAEIDLITSKFRYKIANEENFVTWENEEVEVKPLIRKWRGTFIKGEFKNYALNNLYVHNPTMGKKDVERNLKILNDNIEVMGTTDGFTRIEKELGINDKIFQRNSTMSALKAYKDLEPFSGKKEIQDEKVLKKRKKREEKVKKRREEIEKKQREEEEVKKKEEMERKEEIKKKYENLPQKREAKIKEMVENTKKIEKPMYRSIQNDYDEKVLMPSLEQKKKALASIRDLHKPIRLDEINDFKQKIDEIVNEKKEKLQKERTEAYETHKKNYNYKEYETNFLEALKERELREKEEAERKENEKKEFTDKMKSYGDMVKEMHWPTVSKKKQLEMQLLKESLKHPIRKRLDASALSNNSGYNRRSAENILGIAKPGFQTDNEDNGEDIRRRKIVWKENPMVPKPQPKKEVQVVDWLQERRKRREEDIQEGIDNKVNPTKNWTKEIETNQLSQQEKYDYIKEKTKQLEEEARRKEEIITIAKSGTIEDRDKVNDTFICK